MQNRGKAEYPEQRLLDCLTRRDELLIQINETLKTLDRVIRIGVPAAKLLDKVEISGLKEIEPAPGPEELAPEPEPIEPAPGPEELTEEETTPAPSAEAPTEGPEQAAAEEPEGAGDLPGEEKAKEEAGGEESAEEVE